MSDFWVVARDGDVGWDGGFAWDGDGGWGGDVAWDGWLVRRGGVKRGVTSSSPVETNARGQEGGGAWDELIAS